MASMATCFTLPHQTLSKLHSYVTVPRFQNIGLASEPVVRASNIADEIRPGSAVESDELPSDMRKRAMGAVDACGRRVTVGDVAGRAGLKLFEAQKALQALASDTHGFLEVSDEGDVLYVFFKDYRAKLVGKSFIMRVEPLIEKAKAKAEYLARVSIGATALISSIHCSCVHCNSCCVLK